MLRKGLLNACSQCIYDDKPFTVECDASDLAIGATLNQSGHPVAFMSRTLTKSAFMFDQRKRSKIKNAKIQQWRFKLGTFEYTIHYRPGIKNLAPDALSRICGSITSTPSSNNLFQVHDTLGHPGITRL